MNHQQPRRARRENRVISRVGTGLGIVTACALAYMMSSVGRAETILLPVTLLATSFLSALVYTRARARRRWQAAWEIYSQRDVSRKPFNSVEQERTFSLVGTN